MEIKNRICSFRFATLLMMLFFIFDIFLQGFKENLVILDVKANVAVLPFLQTDNYFMKIIFLGVIYFYGNVPFMEKEQMYVLMRLGKERWGRKNIIYVVISSFILVVSMVLISMIEMVQAGTFSMKWDAAYKTLSLTGGNGNLSFMIEYPIMKQYGPFQLLLLIMLLDWLVFLMIGLLMYGISLFGHRIAACIVVVVITFFPEIGRVITEKMLYFSPVSWPDCQSWRVGFDNSKPDLAYIFVAAVFLNFLLIIFCQSSVKKMQWRDDI